jgi:hypothetical protein
MVKAPRAARMAVVAGSAAVALLGVAAQSASAAPASVSSRATASNPQTQLYCAWQVIVSTVLILSNGQQLPLPVGNVVYGVPPTSGNYVSVWSPHNGQFGSVYKYDLAVVSCRPIPNPG